MILWKRTATGNWVSEGGKWVIRGPIMGKPMYWLYDGEQHSRYTPTGRFDDCVAFTSLNAAKQFVEENFPPSALKARDTP